MSIERFCAIPACRKPIKDKPSHPRIYCSRACAATARQAHLSPKTPFARFLFDQWRSSGKTLSEWSRDVGLHRETLRELMQGSLPVQKTHDRLAAVLGEALPPTATETARRRRIILEHQGNPHTPEAVARSAASRLGKSQAPERIAKRIATMAATGGRERANDALRTANRKLPNRILTGLPMRLRGHPGPPSKETLKLWAEQTGEKVGVPAKMVLSVWRPYLRRRELVPPGGRPIQSHRCVIAAEEWAKAPPHRSQRGPDTYWTRVARRVSSVEDVGEPLTADDVKKWASKHPPHPDCPLAKVKQKQVE